ncbi:IMPACT family protein [Pseudoclavibacter sp. 13-3]|uniref:IMPACT family protein n=1 Tax=Pseudoclavibacter sp. 13-3 TaxID=2901228 RepID=UPI001E2C7E25|nr:YigZ family protein [Pseudoclavibacter sp. 13-3]MCD7102118.1 YigZ family protein [Pseudoclavibacter sp. 13-3]
MTHFLTPSATADAEIAVQRSRFLGRLASAENEAQARVVIAQARSAHPQARHHCSAFIVGERADILRTNDDGEPSGTAGRPILDALQSAGLGQVVCVVTRYFGGILLGTGGLSRAYREAAAAAIEQATLRDVRECAVIELAASHHDAAIVQRAARQHGWAQIGADWGESVTLRFGVPLAEAEAAREHMLQVTGGRVRGVQTDRRLM